jgi:hypothetical protein
MPKLKNHREVLSLLLHLLRSDYFPAFAEQAHLEASYVMAFDPTSGDLVCEGAASDEG